MALVLLIEPDSKLAHVYSAALTEAGYEVNHVVHAQDAVHVADKAKPDIVVLEVQLAGHNGIEFVYEFRSYPEWQKLPIILFTMVPADSLQLSTQTIQQLGIVQYLYKPTTDLRRLVRAVKEIA